MPSFKLPLSGDVVQSINPFTAFMTGGQFGLININLGQSSKPEVEQDVLSDVASYGKQLGRIGDALAVLLVHFHPRRPLTADETAAIDALSETLNKIADVKERHGRPAFAPTACRADFAALHPGLERFTSTSRRAFRRTRRALPPLRPIAAWRRGFRQDG
jgi:hypothetical protein